MSGDLAALIISVSLTVLFVMRRTHVAMVTMALCAGYVLSDRISFTLSQNDILPPDSGFPVYTVLKLLLLFGPPVFVAYHFRGTQRGGGRFIEQLAPAFALSLMVIVFILEQLAFDTRASHLDSSVILNQLWLYSAWVVAFALATALFDLLMHKPTERSRHNKKKHHRF